MWDTASKFNIRDVAKMSLPVLAVDMDEVLAQFALGLSAFHNVVYATSLTPASFHSYQFHEVWGGTVEETNQKVSNCIWLF